MTKYEPQVGDIIEFGGKEREVYAVRPTHRTHGEDAGWAFTHADRGLTFIDEDGYEYWALIDHVKFVRRPDRAVTVLADDSLGGVEREFREVKRKACVDERIKIVEATLSCGTYRNGDIMTVRTPDEGVWENLVFAEGAGVGLSPCEYVVLEPTDIVYIDGERFRMVERKATAGERVIIVDVSFPSNYDLGEVFTVDGYKPETDKTLPGIIVDKLRDRRDQNIIGFVQDGKYRVLELIIANTPTLTDAHADMYARIGQRLAELERKVSKMETQLRVAQQDIALVESGAFDHIKLVEAAVEALRVKLDAKQAVEKREPQVGDRVIIVDDHATNIGNARPNIVNGKEYEITQVGASVLEHPYFLEAKRRDENVGGIWCARSAFRLVEDAETDAIGKRQSRDEIVERAKADVVELLSIGRDIESTLEGSEEYRWSFFDADFMVSREGRTTEALVYVMGGRGVRLYDSPKTRGIAKCAPGDVFNAHIGKAIALRRALGLDVPAEYLNAPQPTEVRVGDVVRWNTQGSIRGPVTRLHGPFARFDVQGTEWQFRPCDLTIIDDSRDGGAE